MALDHVAIEWFFANESNPDLSLRMALFHVSNSCRAYLSRCVYIRVDVWRKCQWCNEDWLFHRNALWIYSGLGAMPAPEIYCISPKFYISMIQPRNLKGTQGWISSWITAWDLAGFFRWLLQRKPDQTNTALIRTIWHNLRRIGKYTRRGYTHFGFRNWRKKLLEYAHPKWIALFRNRHDIEITVLLDIGCWKPKPHPTRYPVIEPLREMPEHCPPDADTSTPKRQRVDTFTG